MGDFSGTSINRGLKTMQGGAFMAQMGLTIAGDVANGLFKSLVFAVVIGVVSCHQGLATIGGPRGIGRSVTKAVVNSIVLIVIFDYVLTRVLLK